MAEYTRDFKLIPDPRPVREIRDTTAQIAALYLMQRRVLYKMWRHHDNMANGAPPVTQARHQEIAFELQMLLKMDEGKL